MHHVLIKILILVHKLQDVIWIVIAHVNIWNVIKSFPQKQIQQLMMLIANISHFVSIKIPVRIQHAIKRILLNVTILEDANIITI